MYGKFNARCGDDPAGADCHAIGLVGLILVKVLAPGFYARQNVKTLVRIAARHPGCTQVMNLVFIIPLKARRAVAGHWPGRLPERRAVAAPTAQTGHLSAAGRLGFARRLLLAVLVMAEVLLALNWGRRLIGRISQR